MAPGYWSTGIVSWHTPIAFALDSYYNRSRHPLTIESVALVDPHNVALHGALLYAIPQSRHPLIMETAWDTLSRYARPGAWAARQSVPGAVIPVPRTAVPQISGAVSYVGVCANGGAGLCLQDNGEEDSLVADDTKITTQPAATVKQGWDIVQECGSYGTEWVETGSGRLAHVAAPACRTPDRSASSRWESPAGYASIAVLQRLVSALEKRLELA
jgi:hypothetical protein